MSFKKQKNNQGFTLIELVVATFVIGTTLVGVVGLMVLVLRTAQEGERRVAAVALVNEKAEMVRNLPYAAVGTVGGIPEGAIEPEDVVTRNATTYVVKTDIRYVDDPYDGVLGGGGGGGCIEISHHPPGNPEVCQDLCVAASAVNAHLAHGDSTSLMCDGSPIIGPDVLNTDYKQARVEVSWNSPNNAKPLVMLMTVAPKGIEGGELFGTLDFQALSSLGLGIEGAVVQLVNATVNPAVDISTLTNSEGRVVLPGLPEGAGYELSVSLPGYTGEQTLDQTATFFPDIDHLHLTSLVGEVIEKTFFIDLVSTLTLNTVDEDALPLGSVAYNLKGLKTIGLDELGELVYGVDIDAVTDAGGNASHTPLAWDAYNVTIDGVATGYDIKETSIVMPTTLDPNETADMTLTLVDHTDYSVHVTVTTPTGDPIDNATVQLAGTGYDETLGTGVVGQVFFADLPTAQSYALTIDAPGWVTNNQNVTVDEGERLIIELTPEP